ncbi:MAG: twin-arginine translocase TatA/TatE family subunit [Chloroflexota bacterium]
MPFRLGPFELVIILVIVILIFGVGRISKISGELGSGIRAFREGLKGPEDEAKTESEKENKQE